MWYDPFGMVWDEVIACSPSKLQLSPFLSKQQKVHPARFLWFLHHPQPPRNKSWFKITLKIYIPKNENLLQDRHLEALLKKTKQN